MIIAYLVISLLLAAAQFVNRNKIASRTLTTLFIVVQWLLTFHAFDAQGLVEGKFFRYDALGVLLACVLSIVATAAFAHSSRYITAEGKANQSAMRAQYQGAMQILTMALTMAYLSVHIAVTWIFVEITTLSASALIFYRRNAGSVEATWKYVFACSMSLVLVYVGILFFSIALGENAEEGLSFDVLMELAPTLDAAWLKLAFIFILVGYTAKMSLVPMFNAGIDAKDKAPTPAAAMLSSVVMNAGFVGFYRVYAVVAHTEIASWANIVVLITALLSIFVASVYLIRVQNVKRLFAYSSVEHIGVVMLGIAAGGVGVYAAILHLVLHSFAKSAIFMHIAQLYRVFRTKEIRRMGQYFRFSGTGATFLILAMLCITAMPPSGLFVSEFYVFKSMIDSNLWIPMFVAMVLLTVIVWAIARDIFALLFLPPASAVSSLPPRAVAAPWHETLLQFLLIALAMWFGLMTPQFVADLIAQAANLTL